MLDWPSVLDESVEDFQGLLRIDTSNPPGNELPAIEFLARRLESDGVPVTVYESAPGRGNLVARIAGSGRLQPLLLSAHVDVVPADASRWTHAPFSGVRHDGYLWGRGAVDMKNMAAMALTVMRALKRGGAPLDRDLIFCAVSDEEAGCEFGSRWMVDHHADEIRAEYCLTEVGGYTLHLRGRRFCPVQVAEKGTCRLRITATGAPGHGSVPRSDSAVVKLADAVLRLSRVRLPMRVTAAARAFVDGLARGLGWPASMIVRRLLSPSVGDFLLEKAFPDEGLRATFAALLRNTATPTMVRGGDKINVIPGSAEVLVDGRIIPGVGAEEFVLEVRRVLGREDYDIEVLDYSPGCEHPADDPILGVIGKVMGALDPGVRVIPSITPGYTDAAQWSRLGIKCYGFSPVRLPPNLNFQALFHGHDERIPVEGYRFGVQALHEVVQRLCRPDSA